jgi:hypothetical protein
MPIPTLAVTLPGSTVKEPLFVVVGVGERRRSVRDGERNRDGCRRRCDSVITKFMVFEPLFLDDRRVVDGHGRNGIVICNRAEALCVADGSVARKKRLTKNVSLGSS